MGQLEHVEDMSWFVFLSVGGGFVYFPRHLLAEHGNHYQGG
jgi:hypothetical protein